MDGNMPERERLPRIENRLPMSGVIVEFPKKQVTWKSSGLSVDQRLALVRAELASISTS